MRAKRYLYRISTLVIVQMGFEIASTWLKQFDKHISKLVINPFVVLWTSHLSLLMSKLSLIAYRACFPEYS